MFSQDLHENSKYYYLSWKVRSYNEEEKMLSALRTGSGVSWKEKPELEVYRIITVTKTEIDELLEIL